MHPHWLCLLMLLLLSRCHFYLQHCYGPPMVLKQQPPHPVPLFLSPAHCLCVCHDSVHLVGLCHLAPAHTSVILRLNCNNQQSKLQSSTTTIIHVNLIHYYLIYLFLSHLLVEIFRVWARTNVVTFDATISKSYQVSLLTYFVWEVWLIKCPFTSFLGPQGWILTNCGRITSKDSIGHDSGPDIA